MRHAQPCLLMLTLISISISANADKAGETFLAESIASMKKLKSVQFDFTLYETDAEKKENKSAQGTYASMGKTMFYEMTEHFDEDPMYAGKTLFFFDNKVVTSYDIKRNRYETFALEKMPPALAKQMYYVFPEKLLEVRRSCKSATIGKPIKVDSVTCQTLEMRQPTLSGNPMLFQFFFDADKILRGYRISGEFDNRRYTTKNMKINADIPLEIKQWKVPADAKKLEK